MGLWVKDDGKSESLVVMTKIGLEIPTRDIQLERVQTSVRSLVARELVEFLKRGKQMNIAQTMCAPINQQLERHGINWAKCYKMVRKLQVRIAKAFREGKYGKAKAFIVSLICLDNISLTRKEFQIKILFYKSISAQLSMVS